MVAICWLFQPRQIFFSIDAISETVDVLNVIKCAASGTRQRVRYKILLTIVLSAPRKTGEQAREVLPHTADNSLPTPDVALSPQPVQDIQLAPTQTSIPVEPKKRVDL